MLCYLVMVRWYGLGRGRVHRSLPKCTNHHRIDMYMTTTHAYRVLAAFLEKLLSLSPAGAAPPPQEAPVRTCMHPCVCVCVCVS